MAPLWHYFEETMAWYGPDDRPAKLDATALQHPAWDWVTVAVATCSRSCHGCQDGQYIVAEECVAGFNLLQGVDACAPARTKAMAKVLQGDAGCAQVLRGGSDIAIGSLPVVDERTDGRT